MSQPVFNVTPAVSLSPELGFLHTRLGRRMIPAFISPEAVTALQENWDTTAQDILICTHQKVGTHLTKKFIVEILRQTGALQAHHPAADGDIGKGAVPWPEVTASQDGIDAFFDFLERTKGQPRVFYTHANADELPVRRLHPKTRLIMTYRSRLPVPLLQKAPNPRRLARPHLGSIRRSLSRRRPVLRRLP